MGSLGVRFVGDMYLLHMNARYYNVRLKRFLTPDPIGLDGGFNLYLYANANPVFYVDPLGLCPNSGSSQQRTYYLEQGGGVARGQSSHDPGSLEQRQSYVQYDRVKTMTLGAGFDQNTEFANQMAMDNAFDMVFTPASAVTFGGLGGRIAKALGRVPKKGTTVIGHLPDYPKVAKKMGANYLRPSANWNFQKQGQFVKGVIESGDDVL
ncbi:MAG: RHS repeat-associated core domain-containing protein [Spartobacteria bacterium]|nr:RHS repeat-associated core domain-containing protein [Spartobacteria bacterium]